MKQECESTLFVLQPRPSAPPPSKLMLLPPHRAGDPPSAVQQLLSRRKVWQEIAVLSLPLGEALRARLRYRLSAPLLKSRREIHPVCHR